MAVLTAACAQAVGPALTGVDVALTTPHHPVEGVTDCEPNWGFEDHGLVLFAASDAQLHELARCQYLGLSLDRRADNAPRLAAGDCHLLDHASYALYLRRSTGVSGSCAIGRRFGRRPRNPERHAAIICARSRTWLAVHRPSTRGCSCCNSP